MHTYYNIYKVVILMDTKDVILELRTKKGLSQDELAEKLYVKRNRHLVDNSSACISYLTENKGGTFYTVNYAKSKGVEVINIAE